ncbi:MAG: hypothetical protein BWY74_00145 [Firmicutes bacterium ADurb.Bin419]|nr:MAG: hypothetical protein BWY74_00145 [Firmicutes bacterium ADurb.Bin419]
MSVRFDKAADIPSPATPIPAKAAALLAADLATSLAPLPSPIAVPPPNPAPIKAFLAKLAPNSPHFANLANFNN